MRHIGLIIIMTLNTHACFAKVADSTKIKPFSGGYFFFGMPYTMYNSEASEREGIGDRTIGIEFGLGLIAFRYLHAGGTYGIDIPKDNDQFTESTNAGRKSSSITIPYSSLYIGLRTAPLKIFKKSTSNIRLSCVYGKNWTLNARRTIGGCADCREDEINLEAGDYIHPEIYWGENMGAVDVRIGLGYRHFINSDFGKGITAKIYIGSN